MRWFAAISCASLAVVASAAACSSFGEGDGDPQPGVPEAGVGETGAETSVAEAGACRGGRDAGNACGAAICTKGQTCCLASTTCVATSSCPGTQVNCMSPAECGEDQRCCQVEGSPLGTRCEATCGFGPPLCEKDEDCAPNEYCRAPDSATAPIVYFHCAACPGR